MFNKTNGCESNKGRPEIITRKLKPRLLLTLAIFVVGVMIAGEALAENWYSRLWGYRKMITVQAGQVIGGPHTDFPMLLSLASDSDLAANAQPDFDDILFTASDGTTKLDHEIESYNSGTGALVAWVRIPAPGIDNGTVIYMYYGNSSVGSQQNITGTWNSDYKGVWHLSEDPSGAPPQMQDSTINNNDGTSNGGMTSGDQVAGRVDGSLDFDGSPNNIPIYYVESPNSASLNVTGDITVSAWINPTGGSVTQQGISNKGGTVGSGWWLHYENSVMPPGENCGLDLIHWKSNGNLCSNSTILRNQWTHVVAILDSSNRKIYINGQEDASSGSGGSIGPSASRTHTIGRGTGFDGQIDEVRISDTARSAGWIETSYNNQDDPASFLSFDAQELVSVPTMTEWGMIIFMILAGLISFYCLRRKRINP